MTSSNVQVQCLVLGPVQTNAYLLGDPTTGEAVVIDPAWEGERLARELDRRGWRLTAVWLTHAHFDHIGGSAGLADRFPVPIAMHPADQPLWRMQGGAPLFGFERFDPGPEPTIDLAHGMRIHGVGLTFEVRHVPGHTAGHVLFYAAALQAAFCGDLVFAGGVGRTDLPGGSWEQLLSGIRDQILTLPDETVLYPGHGPHTTVGIERAENPFLAFD